MKVESTWPSSHLEVWIVGPGAVLFARLVSLITAGLNVELDSLVVEFSWVTGLSDDWSLSLRKRMIGTVLLIAMTWGNWD